MKTKMAETADSQVNSGYRVTLVGVLVNTFLIIFKFLAGIFGHSQALIADAVHSISDLVTDFVVLFGLKIGRKTPDKDHHFGHARFETLSSSIIGLGLISIAVYLGIEAAFNIYRHTEHHPTWLAIGMAGLSIAVKETLYRYTIHVGKSIGSVAITANAWHHRSDALSSVAVLLGVTGAWINPDWHILDSYTALLVSFFIIKVGLEVLRESVREFTDSAPDSKIVDEIRNCACHVKGVIDVHDLKVRTSGGRYQMVLHIVVNRNLNVVEGHRIAKEVEVCLTEVFQDLDQLIVHVDPSIE
ncbi:MAG: cation diffusion facilitator family transporter [Thermodesulfobacteriota bacterium]|nr:cation diffusion facilitator family transporter [Thermodesulfobacteriota bacterium]